MIRILLFTCCLLLGGITALAQHAGLLSGKFTPAALKQVLVPQAQWKPFPLPADRAGWAKADAAAANALVKKAEGYLNYEWPGVPAVKSLLIVRTGNRDEYQTISFKKREVLGTLLLAETYENKGRFLDDIVNGVWSICEESFWGASAHLPKSKDYAGLPDVSDPFVDLFAAETATYLAWTDYFLGDKLEAISPQLRKRIYYETNRRIFEPLMTKHHGWMASNAAGRRPNNWNPWICSNWLNSVLLLEKDDTKRAAAVSKLLQVLDEFLTPYPADGGCDEGPGYWGAAAASLYDNISLLNLASNNAFSYACADEKVRNMGRFIYRAQISERYFVNFADASPQPGMAAGMIYRYGKDIKDADMMEFGAYYNKGAESKRGTLERFHFFRNLFALFLQNELNAAPKGLPLPANVWWPDLQVMVARDREGSTDGFFMAAKGGNNDESHNHNDLGNYIVYYNGLPLLIDIGSGTYTAKTFSNKRYEIWYNCSDYHNVPTVNGQTQPPGARFKAQQVAYSSGGSHSRMSMDLSAAYPEAAGINEWKRTIELNRKKNVQVTDAFSLKTGGDITEHLMTCYPVEVKQPGTLVIHYQSGEGGAQDMYVHYPAGLLDATVEKVLLETAEDQGVKRGWGDNIYRINLKTKSPQKKGSFSFRVALQ
jgi:hypothetical protein